MGQPSTQPAFLGVFSTLAALIAAHPNAKQAITAFTQDQGPAYSNGTTWLTYGSGAATPPKFSNNVTSPSLSTAQNNFNPSGATPGVTNYFEIVLAANVTVTGWAAPGIDGFTVAGFNKSDFTLSFTDHDAGSTAANQFSTPGATPGTNPPNTAGPYTGWLMRYDGGLSKWTFLS
jgi:hypothetical protein